MEESTNTQRTPYLFTAKELDEETGLYYFGARYYDARTSVWQSADPILEKYLDTPSLGKGGILNSRNLGLYSYTHLNPVRLIDPDGNVPIDTIPDIGYVVYDAGQVLGAGAAYVVGAFSGNKSLRSEGLAGLKEKGGDLAASIAGAVTPYVPAAVTRGARTAAKLPDNAGGAAKETGVIYKVAGEKTASGKPYIGSANDLDKRAKTARDGRDRSNAEVIGTYPLGDTKARRIAEQKAMDAQGGIGNLDNKRNEIAPKNREKYGLD